MLLTFNVLILKLEAPRGCLERLIQPVCLGALLFMSSCHARQRALCFSQTVRVAECFAFWLQLVNFSESVDPGVRREVFSQHEELPERLSGLLEISGILRARDG